MIQQETILQVIDNSGAKTVKCIKVLGGYKKKYAKLGDLIIVSVQELRNKSKSTSKVKKGEIYKALIVRTQKNIKKKDGGIEFFRQQTKNNNSVALIDRKGSLIGTRITEPVSLTLKKKQFIKFLNLSVGLI